MRIALVPHVKQEPIVAEIKDVMQGNCQLDDAQIGSQVTADFRHLLADSVTDFRRQPRQIGDGQRPDIGRRLDG